MPQPNRSRVFRRAAALASTCLTLSAVVLTMSSPAYASTSYNGKDPVSTGCSSTGSTKAFADGNGFIIELHWSTACASAWADIYAERGAYDAANPPTAEIISEKNGVVQATYACHNLTSYNSTYTTCHTAMVNDGIGLAAEAYGENDGDGVYTGWF
ncbi:DUF2690 domain-containing protein [Streptomyces sp. NPDC101455]|uniref:DUF2690 domain-containing protein n=1 Tax=Streptomyces sp. NPDC101455 TaxID=3366142 RepID=UPI003824DBD9